MPHGSERAPSWQVGGGKRGILPNEFDVSNTPNNNTVYTDMCAFSHDSLTLSARLGVCGLGLPLRSGWQGRAPPAFSHHTCPTPATCSLEGLPPTLRLGAWRLTAWAAWWASGC